MLTIYYSDGQQLDSSTARGPLSRASLLIESGFRIAGFRASRLIIVDLGDDPTTGRANSGEAKVR
jgi:hypothetical protein